LGFKEGWTRRIIGEKSQSIKGDETGLAIGQLVSELLTNRLLISGVGNVLISFFFLGGGKE
jgi:hypothetical protein